VEAVEEEGDSGGLWETATAADGRAGAEDRWVEHVGDERQDLDTRLLRAETLKVAGPRLRSS
jgi:hypothetical protein